MAFKQNTPMIWKYETGGDEIIGILEAVEENTTYEGKKIYRLKVEDDSIITVFGTTVLDGQMIGVNIGDRIKIIYNGTKESKDKGKKPMKLFTVFIDEE